MVKSRLVYELIHSHATQLARAGAPRWPTGALRRTSRSLTCSQRYRHIDDSDDARTMRAKVTGQVLTLDEMLQDTLPALLALLDVVPEDSRLSQLDPPQRRRHARCPQARALRARSQVQPLLLVFEDLHWIDSETQALPTA